LENGKPLATAGRKTSGLASRGSGAVNGVQVMHNVRSASIVSGRGPRLLSGTGGVSLCWPKRPASEQLASSRVAGAPTSELPPIAARLRRILQPNSKPGGSGWSLRRPRRHGTRRSVHFARRWSPRPSWPGCAPPDPNGRGAF